MTITPKKPQIKKLKKADITDEMRKAVGACQHDHVNYKALEKLSNGIYKRLKSDEKQFKILAQSIINLQGTVKFQQELILNHRELQKALIDKYENALENQGKELEECHKDKNEITRAYNGLAKMGRYAESIGVDIEEASKNLPESQKNKYDFKQKHTLLESGKINHEYFFGKKKNGKAKE
tara:strand:+ start:5022 stop:5561 length:540 start_codon:yes stop_codon:yes gene_type:complete